MTEVRVLPAERQPLLRFASSLIVALGAMTIAVVKVGVQWAIPMVVVGVAIVVAYFRLGPRIDRRRLRRRLHPDPGELVAAALSGREIGAVRIGRGAIQFLAHRDLSTVRVWTPDDVAIAELAPRPGMGKATRVRLIEADGAQSQITITAPVTEVEAALRRQA